MPESHAVRTEPPSQGELATEQWKSLLDKRVGPGILVLASPARVQYMNRTAWEMIQELLLWEGEAGEIEGGKARGLLPASLRKACEEIFYRLAEQPCAKDLEEFEAKRLVKIEHRPLLIRAFAVTEELSSSGSRAIVLLERVGSRAGLATTTGSKDFSLTTREQAVVRCLAKGWTNKEIAGALQLALPTVKEHIRHIMEKTHTTTRTGLLMKVFQGGAPSGDGGIDRQGELAVSPPAATVPMTSPGPCASPAPRRRPPAAPAGAGSVSPRTGSGLRTCRRPGP